MYAAGWHIQVKRLGGFSGEVRRMLRREVDRIGYDDGLSSVAPADAPVAGKVSSSRNRLPVDERSKLVPGARLLRDWNGRTHAVDVMENGYVYEGETYRSLSAIARRITEVHWSGPRFFGL